MGISQFWSNFIHGWDVVSGTFPCMFGKECLENGAFGCFVSCVLVGMKSVAVVFVRCWCSRTRDGRRGAERTAALFPPPLQTVRPYPDELAANSSRPYRIHVGVFFSSSITIWFLSLPGLVVLFSCRGCVELGPVSFLACHSMAWSIGLSALPAVALFGAQRQIYRR